MGIPTVYIEEEYVLENWEEVGSPSQPWIQRFNNSNYFMLYVPSRYGGSPWPSYHSNLKATTSYFRKENVLKGKPKCKWIESKGKT